jgi:hypothetical protein
MSLQIASIFLRGSMPGQYVWIVAIYLVIGLVLIAAGYRKFILQWLNGIRGKDWARVSAVIDLVSVADRTEHVRGTTLPRFDATLTYFYRNPDLQTGDYSRIFGNEDDAKEWADSYKGRTVFVHVDPRNPANSVLRKEEL